MSLFQKATKDAVFLKVALLGPSGSGKSYSGLALASEIAGDRRVAALDTERGSLSKYSDIFDFDVIAPTTFEPSVFINALNEAVRAGYGCMVIDSLSHAWIGAGGILEYHDAVARRTPKNDSFGAWREATPEHNKLVDALLNAQIHLIVTMRTKMEHVITEDDRGKKIVQKLGMAPVQRAGLEYEFDIIGDMDGGRLTISKTRCPALTNKSFLHPGADVAAIMREWAGAAPRVVDPPAFTTAAPTPEQPAPAAPLDPLLERFKAACNALGIDPREGAKSLVVHHGVNSWAALMEAQIETRVRELEARVAAPAAPAQAEIPGTAVTIAGYF